MMNTYNNGTAALKMPSNYVLMTEEEMIYVDGGSEGTYRKTAQDRTKEIWAKMTSAQKAEADRKAKTAAGTTFWYTAGASLIVFAPAGSALIAAGLVVTVGGYLYSLSTL